MLNKNFLTILSILGFIYIFFIALLAHEIDDSTYLSITFFIGLPLFLIFILANSVKSEILFFYSGFALVASLFSSYGLFYNYERFMPSGGQASIKDFDFSVFSLIELYVPILYFHLLVIIFFLFAWYFFIKNYSDIEVPPNRIIVSHKNNYVKKQFFIITILFCFFMFYINYFMFNNSIGIGGVAKTRLPFKLTGILFYFSRFIAPLIILYLVLNLKTSLFLFILLSSLAVFSSFTSLSKAVLFLYSSPLILLLLRDKKILLLGIFLILVMFTYEAVGMGRSIVYLVEDGIVRRNLDIDIFSVLFQASKMINVSDINFLNILFGFGERIGGGQDIVLASQMNLEVVDTYAFDEFFRIFFVNTDMAGPVANEFYDFQPKNYGIATGDGGFFAHIITISSGRYMIITMLSLFIAFCLFIFHISIQSLDKLFLPKEIKVFISLFIILYIFGFSGNFKIPMYIILITFIVTQITFLKNFIIKYFSQYAN